MAEEAQNETTVKVSRIRLAASAAKAKLDSALVSDTALSIESNAKKVGKEILDTAGWATFEITTPLRGILRKVRERKAKYHKAMDE